jgi:hypothetical protein
MMVYTGSTRKRTFISVLARNGWGRCFSLTVEPAKPQTGEPWLCDNGVYAAYSRGSEWDGDTYQERLERAETECHPASVLVLPDVVGDAVASKQRSLQWLFKMPSGWPLYYVLQDGVMERDLRGLDEHLTGLFLGGTDRFKAKADRWCRVAHERGLLFHYGRAGTVHKIRHAQRVGADSLDSAFPLWTQERFERFVRVVTGAECEAQTEIEFELEEAAKSDE